MKSATMPKTTSVLQKNIALPQDHGSWVFILTPLAVGLFAGGTFSAASLALVVAAMLAFLIRQPIIVTIKALSGRRPRSELPAAVFWIGLYGFILLLSVGALVALGQAIILILAIPAAPVFAWHLMLVSRREERKQAGIEILATGVLALAAPAAFWIGKGSTESAGWLLWVLTWFQSAASIVYAYLRLEQRKWITAPALGGLIKAGSRALVYTIFNLILAASLSFFNIIPPFVWLAFLIQALEAMWGTLKPALNAKPVSIGMRQLMVTILFTILFIITWR